MATRELSDEEHQYLNRLSEVRREKRRLAAEASAKCRSKKREWQSWYEMLRKEAEEAHKQYVSESRRHGINSRQEAWQREKWSKGLCRQCGNEGLPDSKLCEECLEKTRAHNKAQS